jgi:hypothetical protein
MKNDLGRNIAETVSIFMRKARVRYQYPHYVVQ